MKALTWSPLMSMHKSNSSKIGSDRCAAEHDWSRLDEMTEAEKHAAAVSDPDNPPLTEEDMRRMKQTPRAKIIRRALGLTQEEFAALTASPSARCATGSKAAPSRTKAPGPISW
jgi:DNA-binding transcriptional regulator YiaG